MEVLSMLAGYTGGSAKSRFQDAISVQSSSGYLLRQYSALCDLDSPKACEEEMNNCGSERCGEEGEGEGIIKSRNRTIFPLISREFYAKEILQAHPPRRPSEHECPRVPLIKMLGCELFPLLSPCLDPSRREESRLSAVEIIGHLLRILSRQLPISPNGVSQVLLSYTARDRLVMQNVDGLGKNQFSDCYTSVCEAARGGIALALGALCDGSDDVCKAALELLHTAAPLILQHQHDVRSMLCCCLIF